jgi:putative nucleotidyltransferase with HDIG domain
MPSRTRWHMIGACGLLCGDCDIFRGASSPDVALRVAEWFRTHRGVELALGDIHCRGCRASREEHWFPDCWILKCSVHDRRLDSCAACRCFPCRALQQRAAGSPRFNDALERLKKMKFDRDSAWELVNEFTENQNLVRHMLAVEAGMRAYARKYEEDEELWGIVGLVHDFDYEQNPDLSVEGHPVTGAKILRDRGWPEQIVRAMLSHASEYTGVAPESSMEKALCAVDDLTGFLVAVALVRPSKSIRDVKLKSVRKKWRDKGFAAAVGREQIERAAAALGVEREEHIQTVLDAMKEIAPELGLAGV